MKIGFPVLKKDLIEYLMLDKNLHSSNYFCVFNPKEESFRVLLTESVYNDSEGMGLIHFLKSESISAIISPECHPMAAKFFKDNQMDVFKAIGTSVVENLHKFQNNDLLTFNEDNIIQKSCSSDCSSCSSTCSEEVQELVAI